MRFRARVSTLVLSLVVALLSVFSLNVAVSAAPYGSCNYGSGTYDAASGTCSPGGDESLADTGDSSLYVGIGAVVLSVIALTVILTRKKPKAPRPDAQS